MSFSCKFQLNNGALKDSDKIIFDGFIDSAFGKFHHQKINIARINYNGRDAFISTNCPCFVSSKGKLEFGDNVDEETVIGHFAANGEDIPYGKPYALIIEKSESTMNS